LGKLAPALSPLRADDVGEAFKPFIGRRLYLAR
jgi:hypothetical protein